MPGKRSAPALCLTFLLLLTSGMNRAAAGESVPKEVTEAAVEKAIATVYPALVQIHVLALQYDSGRERKFQAAGSGAIISPEGHVVTNHHVAGKCAAIKCVLSTKEELNATLVGTDPLADIAVVKLDLSSRPAGAAPLAVARFGDAEALKVGDPVLAMGCPLALSQSVTRGIVSNKDMMIPRMLSDSGVHLEMEGEDVGSLVKWLGHDAQIFPGNSGGPLVNLRGEIVGVNEIGLGLGGAIPSEIAKMVAQELIGSGRVRRAFIGAEFQPELKASAGGPVHGVLVSSVIPGAPAERAGFLPGDVVLAVDGQPVQARFQQELPSFTKLILSKPVDKPIEFKVSRGNKELSLTVQTELRDDAKGKDTEAKEWGLTIRRLSVMEAKELHRPDQKGVLVGSVRPGGPSDQAQPPLQPRDILVEAGGKPVSDLEGFLKVTAEITQGKTEPVPTLVAFERRAERGLTLVEVGIRVPQEPPAEVAKAWLPVATQVLSRKLATALNLKGKKGVRITQVYPDTVAQEAGFKAGDILTHIDELPIEASEPQDSQVFETMLRAYKAGAKAEFTVIRGAQTLKVSSALIGAPKEERELRTYEDVAFEFKSRDITFLDRIKHSWKKEEAGALVTQADYGGWAAVGGLRADDLIQAVDGQRVAETRDLENLLAKVHQTQPKQIVFLVRRGIHTHFVELEPKWPEKK
ncbi:MAG: PDZ domain-containing protein [Planctomycetota bacterium]